MKSDAQKAAERLGVNFVECAHCKQHFPWDSDETFSVVTRIDDGDFDDGNNDVVFCCSHVCASRHHATLPESSAIIWRGGRCGGTPMPSLEEP